ncbi:hypothetical protein H6504_01515 [Candidatus Woesearchaeota archaeon]|nr:hypothetical protein [Candidatus Woesearchaeota archaeon]
MKILFVCSGNTFRSVSAEYSLRDFIEKHQLKGIGVTSAGTTARPQKLRASLVKAFSKAGINCSMHTQRKLTEKMLDSADVVIAMGKEHQEFILEHFGYHVPLFNALTIGKETSVLDVEQALSVEQRTPTNMDAYVTKTAMQIHHRIPKLFTFLPS